MKKTIIIIAALAVLAACWLVDPERVVDWFAVVTDWGFGGL
jgi:hypothetical protein